MWKAWHRVRVAEKNQLIEEAGKLINAERVLEYEKKFAEFKEGELNYPILQDLVNQAKYVKMSVTLPNRTIITIEPLPSYEEVMRQRKLKAQADEAALGFLDK